MKGLTESSGWRWFFKCGERVRMGSSEGVVVEVEDEDEDEEKRGDG